MRFMYVCVCLLGLTVTIQTLFDFFVFVCGRLYGGFDSKRDFRKSDEREALI